MKRQDILLAALASVPGRTFRPVHLQKTLFLLDRRVPKLFGATSRYDFQPYDYGPFDSAVYTDVEKLALQGLVEIDKDPIRGHKLYSATESGASQGATFLKGLAREHASAIRNTARLVTKLSFRDLVAAIYKAYPEMKANSVFK